MFWHDHGMGLFGAVVMIVVTLAFVAAAVAAVVVVRATPRDDGGPAPDRILADRYARGEITDEEYHHHFSTLHRP